MPRYGGQQFWEMDEPMPQQASPVRKSKAPLVIGAALLVILAIVCGFLAVAGAKADAFPERRLGVSKTPYPPS
jgi:hypothetical protein